MPNNAEIILTSAKPKASFVKRPEHDKAMRILLLGNFSGHRKRMDSGQHDGYSIKPIDIDNFDQVLASIRPILNLSLDDSLPEITVDFAELDDFHPDTLFAKIGLFAHFFRLRQSLVNPATFKQGAVELQKILKLSRLEQHPSSSAGSSKDENDELTLRRLLGKSPEHDTANPSVVGTEQIALSYIRQVISEHIVEDITSLQSVYIQAVDDAISLLMRKLLHHPDFQSLEAAWRSLYMLVTSLETDETLSLHLLDSDKQQLGQDLLSKGIDLTTTDLYQLLVTQTVHSYGEEPWSLIIGNYSFADSEDELALLAAMGGIASHAGGPFIAAAAPILLGCQSLPDQPAFRDWAFRDNNPDDKNWRKLRKSPVAPWIGLALPRVLLRLPYGPDTDPIDFFQFEELGTQAGHEDLLWGNSAFYCALLIARTFEDQGWDMQLGDYLEIADLPAFIERKGEESRLKPCAEVCIDDHTMEKILGQGVMAFLSHRNLNLVRLVRFQSIADPLENLRAAWNHY